MRVLRFEAKTDQIVNGNPVPGFGSPAFDLQEDRQGLAPDRPRQLPPARRDLEEQPRCRKISPVTGLDVRHLARGSPWSRANGSVGTARRTRGLRGELTSGATRDRTGDLLHLMALCQLSYSPEGRRSLPGSGGRGGLRPGLVETEIEVGRFVPEVFEVVALPGFLGEDVEDAVDT